MKCIGVRPTKRRVLSRIKSAFAGRPYPGFEVLMDESNVSGDEGYDLIDLIGKYPWQDVDRNVPYDSLAYNITGMSFISKETFAYYLPAFMIASLKYEWANDNVLGNVLSSLTYHEEYDWSRERLALFNNDERNAIRMYLDFLKYFGGGELGHGRDAEKVLASLTSIWD